MLGLGWFRIEKAEFCIFRILQCGCTAWPVSALSFSDSARVSLCRCIVGHRSLPKCAGHCDALNAPEFLLRSKAQNIVEISCILQSNANEISTLRYNFV